jgi:hypothetical protein
MTEIVELKVKTEKLEKRQLDYERQRELDSQVKKIPKRQLAVQQGSRLLQLRKALTKKKTKCF